MPETTHTDGGDEDPTPDGNAPGTPDDGVRIDLISADRMADLASMEKIRLILDGVHDGNIVVLEEGLSPDEESKLIEVTMTEISPDEFSGIEIETYPGDADPGFLDRILGNDPARLTIIGPANRIETLQKDEAFISTIVSG
jgi:hypothetical protein